MNSSSSSSSWPSDPEDIFIRRVHRASITVLGDSAVGRAVRQLCDAHAESRRSIATDRTSGAMVVAIVGATGQGKSWLMRQFIKSPSVAAAIRSGNNADEATEVITWAGPIPPANLDIRFEQYLHCDSDQMQSLGVPYLLVDSPGSTDNRRDVAENARLVLSMASVLLMVVRRDQLRSHTVDVLASASEGSLVVPVINAVGEWDDAASADTEAFVARLRRAAPRSQVTAAVQIPDFETGGRQESTVGSEAVAAIHKALMAESAQGESIGRTVHRLAAMDARFRSALHTTLHDQLPSLAVAVQRLNDEARALPEQIAASLVGGGASLRAAIRSRLRASLVTGTSAIWFPYRTVLGVLSLTNGAWDRVVLSLAGSLPSLIGATYTSMRNLNQSGAAASEVREGIRKRSAAAVADRLGPLAARFRTEIHRLSDNHLPTAGDSSVSTHENDRVRTQPAYLAGIDSLQELSQQIFDEEIDRASASRAMAMGCGAVGTVLFWILMAGPVTTLYRDYVKACFVALRNFAGDLSQFPRLDAAMLLTSLLLSVLPMAIFTMIVLSWVQGRTRVGRAEDSIRERHREAIAKLQSQRVLRLEWDDPLLADAEFLLTAGHADSTHRGGQAG
ncbi:MAG: hypothetical protein ACO1RT_10500 [Planctomycetaceae bacterium]